MIRAAAAASAYGPGGHSAAMRALRRRRDGSVSIRVSVKPASVAASQVTTSCAGGTPTIESPTSSGDASSSSATRALAPETIAWGADPRILARGSRSSRTPRSTRSRWAAPAQTTIDAAAIPPSLLSRATPSSPCHSTPPARSAMTSTEAPPAVNMSVDPDTWTAKLSIGAASAMSSAFPSAMRPFSSISRIEGTTFLRASACASAPPSSPAPMMATSRIGGLL